MTGSGAALTIIWAAPKNICASGGTAIAPYKILPAVVRAVSEVVEKRLRLFKFR
jgi:hypothetical protein